MDAPPLAARGHALARTLDSLAGLQAVVWATELVGLVGLLRRGSRDRRAALYLLAGSAPAASACRPAATSFPHYFQQLIAPVAILAGAGAALMIRAGEELLPSAGGAGAILRALLRAALPLALMLQLVLQPFLLRYTAEQAVREIYPGNRFDLMPHVAERVQEISRPTDTAFVFAAKPEILFHARRRSASRYSYLFSLYGPYSGALEEQWATAAEVDAADRAVVVLLSNGRFRMPGAPQYPTTWTRRWLEEDFDLDRQIVVDRSGLAFLVDPGQRLSPGAVRRGIYARRRSE